MRFLDLIKLALNNLWRRKLRSFLTISAVVIGTCSIVGLVSLAWGAQNVFIGQLDSNGMLNRITVVRATDEENLDFFGGNWTETFDENSVILDDEVLEKIKALPNIQKASVSFRIDPLQYATLPNSDKKVPIYTQSLGNEILEDYNLTAGRLFTDNNEENVIIVETETAERFNENNPAKALGQVITFYTWEGYHNSKEDLPSQNNSNEEDWQKVTAIEMTIIGIIDPGMEGGNNYLSPGWGKKINTNVWWAPPSEEEWEEYNTKYEEATKNWPNSYPPSAEDLGIEEPQQEIEIQNRIIEKGYDTIIASVNNSENVVQAGLDIKDLGVSAITAEEFLDEILKLFLIIQIVLAAIGGIALFVAAIGIINTMVMSIMERTKEIGVMRAVGSTKKTIKRLFTVEAGAIGFFGGAIGICIGIGVGFLVNYIGNIILAGQGMAEVTIITFPWWLIVGTIAFGTIVGLLSGLYPARKAAKLNPIDALRRD